MPFFGLMRPIYQCIHFSIRLTIILPLLKECDGSGLTFPFGRRDIQSRDITVKCCETDLCNYPSSTQPTMTTTTMPTVTSSPSGT